jgi:hypothetical protein
VLNKFQRCLDPHTILQPTPQIELDIVRGNSPRFAGTAILEEQRDISLVGEASDGREAIQQFRAHRSDVI